MRDEVKLFNEQIDKVGTASVELGKKLQPAINQALALMETLKKNGGLNDSQKEYVLTLKDVQATLAAGKEPTQAQIDAIEDLGGKFRNRKTSKSLD